MGLRRPLNHRNGICWDDFGKDRLTRSQAKSVKKKMERTKKQPFQAYLCPSCGGWHVGTKRGARG